MGNQLTNELGAKALKKLKAEDVTPKGTAHPKYVVKFRGLIQATTGLRHSSNRDIPVPHLKTDLRANLAFVLDLARCPKDRDDWLQLQGLLAPGEKENPDSEPTDRK